jgi:hypothetical protein
MYVYPPLRMNCRSFSKSVCGDGAGAGAAAVSEGVLLLLVFFGAEPPQRAKSKTIAIRIPSDLMVL